MAAARKDQPVLLMGDLNLTPWSPVFARLLETGHLRDGCVARGLTTTWPAHFLWLGVLIDHILINQKIAVLESRVAEDIGSDHRPVVADPGISLAGQPPLELCSPNVLASGDGFR